LIWISTNNGLIAYDQKCDKYRRYGQSDGLEDTHIYSVMPTHSTLWISTNRGLSRGEITLREGERFPQISFATYHENDGIAQEEFNTGAYHLGRSGLFYFGGTRGVTWLDPQ
jgi:ligand-binding sensor domain-containing protein